MPLTEDAMKEIREGIRIVREDRFEKFARGSLTKHAPKEDVKDPKDELIITDEEKEKVKAPPKDEKEKETTTDDTPVRHSKYWGEILD